MKIDRRVLFPSFIPYTEDVCEDRFDSGVGRLGDSTVVQHIGNIRFFVIQTRRRLMFS
jgi:hypothetical protein